tara:strand:+ start:3466 stop:4599 length:1134 start_codon:yes stop_codon:yes gene_type:complete
MKILQAKRDNKNNWEFLSPKYNLVNPLVFVFGNRYMLESVDIYDDIRQLFPGGHVVFGTTSGEILGQSVADGSVVLTAIEFERSSFLISNENMADHNHSSGQLGKTLVGNLANENLKHIFVVSEGSTVNGSTLIKGMEAVLDTNVTISGGLCGDDARFERTLASYNSNPREGEVIAIGLYGGTMEVSCANYGGWTAFGPMRTITKSIDNVLYELDGKPALDLYKSYLGAKANELPQAALLYPLNVSEPGSNVEIVRTILNIDEMENSMILAGDVPEGSKVQLMMSTVDNIAEGASKAATFGMKNRVKSPELAILVSCVGRKLVMDQRTEEEVEGVIETIGAQAKVIGFYSYGEIAPFAGQHSSKLHNQTMTLTLLSE